MVSSYRHICIIIIQLHTKYCTISIDSSPLWHHDMPDKILISSGGQMTHDKVKILSTMLIAVTPELGNHPSPSWNVNYCTWHMEISFWGLEVCFRCPAEISNSLNSPTNLYLWTLLRIVVRAQHYTNHNAKSDNVLYPSLAGDSSRCTSRGLLWWHNDRMLQTARTTISVS